MSGPQAYPLQWPAGWPRTPARADWKGKSTLQAALNDAQNQLRLLGVKSVVLSSNYTLGQHEPADPGVVAYGLYEGQQIAIPCDRWKTIEGNLRAIARTIEAMRGMERWGAKNMIRAMFQGFTAIRGPGPKPWREVLGIREQERVDADIIEKRRRVLAAQHHPDVPGGNPELMSEINAAADRALQELAA